MDIVKQEKMLRDRRAELVAHLEQVEDQLDETPTKDLEDFATERQGDEVLEALGQVEVNEIARIDAALGRIAAGTYGICLNCDEPISDARLALLPDTPLCKSCAV